MNAILRIGSRPSKLAIIQAEMIRDAIAAFAPEVAAEIVPIRTTGDKLLTPSLAEVGGKGLFIKELEQALVEQRIDIAVHSMKDLPATLPSQFRIVATPPRENPRDGLIAKNGTPLKALPPGTRLGTSSARRKFEALRANPRLTVVPLRGNVDTRIQRVTSGELDAIVVAMAGLRRLGKLAELRVEELDEREFIPAAAQAALAIESLHDDKICASSEVEHAVARLNDLRTECETAAERAFLASIQASCVTPVGVKANLEDDRLELRAILFSTDGAREMSDMISERIVAQSSSMTSRVGEKLGTKMLARGARELLHES